MNLNLAATDIDKLLESQPYHATEYSRGARTSSTRVATCWSNMLDTPAVKHYPIIDYVQKEKQTWLRLIESAIS
jgi:hypothetical protein